MNIAEFVPESKPSFPRCQLHNVSIVHRFPDGCPFSAENPMQALGAIQDRGWSLLGSYHSERRCTGLQVLTVLDTCQSCMNANRTHPVVQRLRRRAGERAA